MARDVSTVFDPPSAWLMRFSPLIKPHAHVLEIACGNGRNTRFLAALGCKVFAADINRPETVPGGVQFIQSDLENDPWPFELESFDAVIGINYLWRPRFADLCKTLKPGGLFLYETFTRAQTTLGFGPKNPQHFLEEGELLRLIASDWHILAYEDGRTGNDRHLQRIAAVRPGKDMPVDVCAAR